MILQPYGHRRQRTLAHPAEVRGSGFLTGADVLLKFQPAPPGTGVVFVRTDLQPSMAVPARYEQVTGTQRRTTLGRPPAQIELVEHVLAALAGLRIDNCIVELNAPEPPGLDGSSAAFSKVLRSVGTVLQQARRDIWSVQQMVSVQAPGAALSLYPAEGDQLKISYILDFGCPSPIGRQSHTATVTPESFHNELAYCRTFLLEFEAIELRRQGYGRQLTTADLLVIGSRGPINNRYRHANELARHKVLDLVGDLSLLGADLRGHLVAYRSGHLLNVELLRTLTGMIAQRAPLAA